MLEPFELMNGVGGGGAGGVRPRLPLDGALRPGPPVPPGAHGDRDLARERSRGGASRWIFINFHQFSWIFTRFLAIFTGFSPFLTSKRDEF